MIQKYIVKLARVSLGLGYYGYALIAAVLLK